MAPIDRTVQKEKARRDANSRAIQVKRGEQEVLSFSRRVRDRPHRHEVLHFVAIS